MGALATPWALYAQPPSPPWREVGMHLRLADDLDRPQDGYCLDVVGSGRHIRFDMPLIAHNCKPGLYADEAVVLQDDGTLYFPAYGGCVTVMGLNDHALPGASLMLKGCGEASPFLEAGNFQHFDHRDDRRLALGGTNLCLAVGDHSQATFDPTHRWRTLFVTDCDTAAAALSQWRFVDPLEP